MFSLEMEKREFVGLEKNTGLVHYKQTWLTIRNWNATTRQFIELATKLKCRINKTHTLLYKYYNQH